MMENALNGKWDIVADGTLSFLEKEILLMLNLALTQNDSRNYVTLHVIQSSFNIKFNLHSFVQLKYLKYLT